MSRLTNMGASALLATTVMVPHARAADFTLDLGSLPLSETPEGYLVNFYTESAQGLSGTNDPKFTSVVVDGRPLPLQ